MNDEEWLGKARLHIPEDAVVYTSAFKVSDCCGVRFIRVMRHDLDNNIVEDYRLCTECGKRCGMEDW